MSVFTKHAAMDLAHTALGAVPDVRTFQERADAMQAAIEAKKRAHREDLLAQGPPTTESERRRQGRQAEAFSRELDELQHGLDEGTSELTVARRDAIGAIVAARRAGLRALAQELYESLSVAAEVNQRLVNYERTTARLIESPSELVECAWPELFSEPTRESIFEVRERVARAAGLL